ncbi:MAG: class I SAM-dependent methyltransferase [Puniceicoccales bacterium]|jgi:SAM-dependent methyltransferase|nr:class I SAM-dependent methyltransferase [Puniceicoccales bacterium]
MSHNHTTADALATWERRYAEALDGTAEARDKQPNPWLARHVPAPPAGVRQRALDLGCGAGHDTAWLLAQGFEVTAADLSANALALSLRRNSGARHVQADLLALDHVLPVPALPEDAWHLIVASLSLHYFNLEDTRKVFAAIRARLRPDGLFAFRVNAFDETGAPPDAASSWDLSTIGTDALPRQYFSEEKIHTVLEGQFVLRFLEKQTVSRYGSQKSLYEVVAVKA